MKKIDFMDLSFRDGFQSIYGARVKTEDFLPALKAAVEAGTHYFEVGGGARFQSLYFYCQEDAFEMMDKCRETVGPDVELQTLARGINVVGLSSQPRDIINMHAKLFKKHGISSIRNFDALNDVRNLDYSGHCIHNNGLSHEISITLMGLPPGMKDPYPHSAEFYADCLDHILKAEIPFDRLCFKDASGTTTPRTVHETVKAARKKLPEDVKIHFHTHCTAGMGEMCNMAAIEGGADIIDLAMVPVSGGTGGVDVLGMWHALRGTEYTLDIDYEKYVEAEEVFQECMEKYYTPPEAKEVNPLITLSPMPGGALTANTQMMRDNNCLDKFPEIIKAMREAVERGGCGTSVTPVSQFYFQQAFNNVLMGPWKKIADGYGKMVLGYFGKTPTEPDPEIVKIASEQLNMEPTEEAPVDINDRNPKLGIEAARKRIQEEGLEETEENIFIVACCEDKGVNYLKGEAPLGVRYAEDVKKQEAAKHAPAAPAPAPAAADGEPGVYTVTVDGKSYTVEVAPGTGQVTSVNPGGAAPAAPAQPAPSPAPAAGGDGDAQQITAPMPGNVFKVIKNAGDSVAEGDVIIIMEAMKMEVEIKAPKAGVLQELHVKQGDPLSADQVIGAVA